MRADFKCKLYRFDPESSEWKERGVGQVKLLEHKENHKIRLLMRQEKTLKIRANHIGALRTCAASPLPVFESPFESWDTSSWRYYAQCAPPASERRGSLRRRHLAFDHHLLNALQRKYYKVTAFRGLSKGDCRYEGMTVETYKHRD